MIGKTGLFVASAVWLGTISLAGSAQAHSFAVGGLKAPVAVEQAQYSREQSRAIRRCMQERYGVRSSRGRSPLRFFMVQQCS
jgi:hypothetical protein